MVYHTSWLFIPFLRTLERTGGPFCQFSFIYIVDYTMEEMPVNLGSVLVKLDPVKL